MKRERAEDLLRALVEGEPADPSRVKAAFAEHPDLEREWREIQAIQACLRGGTEERRAVLETASTLGEAPGSRQAEAKLRELIAERAGVQATSAGRGAGAAGRTNARRWPMWALFAAAAGLAFLLLRPSTPVTNDAQDSFSLGEEWIKALPSPTERSRVRFAWEEPLPSGARVHLFVQGRAEGADGWTKLLWDRDLDRTPWSPGPEITASWPRHVRWKLRLLVNDTVKETRWLEFELSP